MVKEFLTRHGVSFTERDIRQDPSAIDELRKLQVMSTPATRIGDEVVVGFDEKRLHSLLDTSMQHAA
ncbi:MAG: glutaredoxin family protein [Armatimonadota bacterium]